MRCPRCYHTRFREATRQEVRVCWTLIREARLMDWPPVKPGVFWLVCPDCGFLDFVQVVEGTLPWGDVLHRVRLVAKGGQ